MTARTSKPKVSAGRRLVVIDGANAIYRAFFAIPALRAPDGTPTNAALGFANILGKVLREERPDMVAVAFDPRGGNFRHRLFKDYKAGRDAPPEDLLTQIPLVRELVEAYGIPVIEVPDFEADDVIATLVASVPEDVSVTIVSTDKDLMQFGFGPRGAGGWSEGSSLWTRRGGGAFWRITRKACSISARW